MCHQVKLSHAVMILREGHLGGRGNQVYQVSFTGNYGKVTKIRCNKLQRTMISHSVSFVCPLLCLRMLLC